MTYIDQIITLANKCKRLSLFPYSLSYKNCSNKCSFCYLHCNNETQELTLEDFKEIANNVVSSIRDNIYKINKDVKIFLILIGGELFHLPNEYYDVYQKLITDLLSICKENKISFNVDLFSNLIYSKNRLNKFIELFNFCKNNNIGVNIDTSYDIHGRFLSEQTLYLWYDNFKTVSEFTTPLVNIILMTSSLEAYIQDRDIPEVKVFKELLKNKTKFAYNGYTIIEKDRYEELPSYDLCVNFFKKIIDDYWTDLPEFEIFYFKEKYKNNLLKEVDPFCGFIDCNILTYSLPKVSDIYNRNIKLGEYGILETYCIHNVSEFMDKTVLKEWPKICNDCNKLYCIQDTKKGEEFILNKYACSTCKFLSFCNAYKDVIRNCYMNYFIDYYTNRKCILRPVLEYIKKKVDDER